MRFSQVIKQPSAFAPLILSALALALLLGHAALFGVMHDTDEGAAAHLFQLLMILQVPIIGYFAVQWLPRAASEPEVGAVCPRAPGRRGARGAGSGVHSGDVGCGRSLAPEREETCSRPTGVGSGTKPATSSRYLR